MTKKKAKRSKVDTLLRQLVQYQEFYKYHQDRIQKRTEAMQKYQRQLQEKLNEKIQEANKATESDSQSIARHEAKIDFVKMQLEKRGVEFDEYLDTELDVNKGKKEEPEPDFADLPDPKEHIDTQAAPPEESDDKYAAMRAKIDKQTEESDEDDDEDEDEDDGFED